MKGRLEDKTSLVVGAASERSLGTAIADRLIAEGAKVAVGCHPRSADWVKAHFEDRVAGVFPFDAADEASIPAMIEEAAGSLEGFDSLVHCIAYTSPKALRRPLRKLTRDQFHLTMDISVQSLREMVNCGFDHFREGAAVVGLTFSLGSARVFPGYGPMGEAKNALEAEIRYLAYELGQAKKMRAVAIGAGPVPTDSSQAVPEFDEFLEQAAIMAPLGLIEASDVASLCAFVVSNDARRITGVCLEVDGGLGCMGTVGVPVAQ